MVSRCSVSVHCGSFEAVRVYESCIQAVKSWAIMNKYCLSLFSKAKRQRSLLTETNKTDSCPPSITTHYSRFTPSRTFGYSTLHAARTHHPTELACVARRSSQSRREKRMVKPRKQVYLFPSRLASLTDSFSRLRRSFLPSRLTETPSYAG